MQFKALPCVLALGLLVACNDSEDTVKYTTVAGVAPNGAAGLFPHDRYTVEDNTTFTGIRVNYTEELDPTITSQKTLSQNIIRQLNQLDGFGTSAGAWVRFSNPIDKSTVAADENVFIGYMEGNTPILIPNEATPTDTQVLIRPATASPPNSENFFFTTRGILDENQLEIGPSKELQKLLRNNDQNPLNQRLRKIAQALVDADIIESTDDLTSLSVFTSQSIHEQSLELAERIQNTPTHAQAEGPCTDETYFRKCFFTFDAIDFVGNDQTIDDDAINSTRTYTLRGVAYLPLLSDAPYEIDYDPSQGFPVSIFGHGLTGDKTQAELIAKYSAPIGVATVAIDAPQHGEHPLLDHSGEDISIIIKLFGIETAPALNVNTRVLRDGWRHSNLDKLALIEAIKSGIELDDDEDTIEFDTNRISYLGASLGAIQSPELLALSTDIHAGLLAVGGARISDIVRFGTTFNSIIGILTQNARADEKDRLYVLLQTGVEVGDGANWAKYIMENRLRGNIIPDIAMQSSIPDEIVPPETALVLARSLGVTLIGHTPRPDALIPTADGPVSANHPSGRTAGYFQTDWMWKPDRNEYVPSTHDKSPDSIESITYWMQAYRTLLLDDIMTLSNPYPVTGAPPKP